VAKKLLEIKSCLKTTKFVKSSVKKRKGVFRGREETKKKNCTSGVHVELPLFHLFVVAYLCVCEIL
jgi:hypothetical protein